MLDKLIGPVSGLLDKVITDKDQAAKLAHEIATMGEKHAQEQIMAQLEILKADAQGNWFQASWSRSRSGDWSRWRSPSSSPPVEWS